jgi:GT2 family glycosyltransferase
VEGILNRTDYANLDVIIVDNGSEKSTSSVYFAEISNDERVQVIRDDGPFNYSRLNNEAAARARGDYLCFLNNDIEIIESDWLTEMMSQVLQRAWERWARACYMRTALCSTRADTGSVWGCRPWPPPFPLVTQSATSGIPNSCARFRL